MSPTCAQRQQDRDTQQFDPLTLSEVNKNQGKFEKEGESKGFLPQKDFEPCHLELERTSFENPFFPVCPLPSESTRLLVIKGFFFFPDSTLLFSREDENFTWKSTKINLNRFCFGNF